MYKLIRNGVHKYPGAKSYKAMRYDALGNADPIEYSLRKINVNDIELKYGDIVYRVSSYFQQVLYILNGLTSFYIY